MDKKEQDWLIIEVNYENLSKEFLFKLEKEASTTPVLIIECKID